MPDIGREQLLKEANLIKSFRHPNVLQFIGVCSIPPTICLVTEYMPLGSLYKQIHNPSVQFNYPLIKSICMDASRGIAYLHHIQCIHRDLKSHNLLVDRGWKVKVCDFGLSRMVGESTMTACGTPCWTAPEILKHEYYTEKADIYSLAIVFWELITRENPYEDLDPFQVVLAVGTQKMRPIIPAYCPFDFAELIRELWKEDFNIRPSADQVVEKLNMLTFTSNTVIN